MQNHSFIFCGCSFFSTSQNHFENVVLLFVTMQNILNSNTCIFNFQINWTICRRQKKSLTVYLFPSVSFSLQSFASWLLLLHSPGDTSETEGCFPDWNCQEQTLQKTRCVIFLMFKLKTNSRLTKKLLALAFGKVSLKGLCLQLFQSIT